MKSRQILLFVVLGLAAGLLPAPAMSATAPARSGPVTEADDAVVVAVIDGSFTPYHWDYAAAQMPQHLDKTRSNDLPLTQAPDKWLAGFPSPKKFDSYSKLPITLDTENPNAASNTLDAQDKPKWDALKQSTAEEINYYWLPGTKVIGAVDFMGNQIHAQPNAHGTGTSSVSVGNLHGTCPECLLVFITYAPSKSDAALDWAMSQPWIDVITNSYGFSYAERERIWNSGNADLQKAASERGQTIFFSSGNGVSNTFSIPNSTYFSSQEGPDWTVTVGAISPGADNHYGRPVTSRSEHGSYSGAGKPADLASIGSNYPSGYGSPTVGGTGTSGFGGTSNATPVIAGIYARALWVARHDMAGPSRIQRNRVIAVGNFRCAGKRPACELKDGKLTAPELRRRLFHGAVHTPAGVTPTIEAPADLPAEPEQEFLSEGHGSYFGRETGKLEPFLKEFDRIIAPLEGRAKPLKRPDGELEWFIVDSFCRQTIWGEWGDGYYLLDKTELPGADPDWPIRSYLEESCPNYTAPPPQAI